MYWFYGAMLIGIGLAIIFLFIYEIAKSSDDKR